MAIPIEALHKSWVMSAEENEICAKLLFLNITLFPIAHSTVIHFLFVPLCIRCMPLNNGYFSTNLKGLENSVTRHFFDVGTWFCMVLNIPPELLLRYHGPTVDTWGVGFIMAEMWT
ncbi:hypothetical protein TSAR_000354, partial [Trichomalopsis sarcophagae]